MAIEIIYTILQEIFLEVINQFGHKRSQQRLDMGDKRPPADK